MSGAILLAAGGTGGHVFPAQALAAELSARGRAVGIVTDRRGGDYGRLFGAAPVYRVAAGTPSARGPAGKLLAMGQILLGVLQAYRLCRRLLPAAVVGFGGYPSLPTMLAARLLSLPRLVHEQNAVLGRVNRLLARRVDAIALSFADTAALPPAGQVRIVETGNPIRPEVQALRSLAYQAPGADGEFRLLVFGGSQGASVFAAVVPQAVAALPAALRARLSVVQQARQEDLQAVRDAYAATGVTADVATFFDDMPARLAAAHLVIARAGAGTVSEIAVAGRPAVLIPYLHAADDHQTRNAAALAGSEAAWTQPQPAFTAAWLADLLQALAATPERLTATAQRAAAAGRPDAAARLADLVEAVAAGTAIGDRARAGAAA